MRIKWSVEGTENRRRKASDRGQDIQIEILKNQNSFILRPQGQAVKRRAKQEAEAKKNL